LSFAAARLQRAQAERPASSKLFASPEKRTVVLCLLLAVASLAVYKPVIRNSFINFDDGQYITHNPHVAAGLNWGTIRWSFSSFDQANWHPLTWISHALDYQLFGASPAGHHYVNVLLHSCNAVLLFLLFQSATGLTGRSLMLAALFALHPVNVESVAWAAERKNTLSMLFFLLALLAYGHYVRKPGVWRYSAVALLFALGLMSKPQIITFPFLLLLWDYWPLGRLGRDSSLTGGRPDAPASSFLQLVLEKWPLFLLSGISAVITMKAQWAGHAIHDPAIYTFRLRLGNAILSYSRYLRNAVWPTRLSPLYPHPLESLRMWQAALSALFVTAITLLVLRHRRHRYLPVGWFWFLGTLIPMLGLVQVGEQAMADRYAYQSFVGLFLIVSWGMAEWTASWKVSPAGVTAVALSVVLGLSYLTYRQIGYWHDSVTLWSYALRVTPENSYLIHRQLGDALDQEGRYDEALPELRAAVNPRHHAGDDLIHLGFGNYYQKHGRPQEALTEYQIALGLSTDAGAKAAAYSDMGSAYRQIGAYERARQSFVAALNLNPKDAMSLVGMGLLAQRKGDLPEAISYYSLAMAYAPTDVGYILLAQAEARAGHFPEAREAASRAAQLTTNLVQARQTVATLLSY
jgi:Flp pilus assembly protein TadD